jgi:hypothetical protein
MTTDARRRRGPPRPTRTTSGTSSTPTRTSRRRWPSSIRDQAKNQGLEDCFSEILVPTEDVVEIRRGRKVNSERKFFPGYVLVKMDLTDEAYHLVKNTPKVTGFLGSGRPSRCRSPKRRSSASSAPGRGRRRAAQAHDQLRDRRAGQGHRRSLRQLQRHRGTGRRRPRPPARGRVDLRPGDPGRAGIQPGRKGRLIAQGTCTAGTCPRTEGVGVGTRETLAGTCPRLLHAAASRQGSPGIKSVGGVCPHHGRIGALTSAA